MVATRKDAASIIRRHFSEVTPEEFRRNVQRFNPPVSDEHSLALPPRADMVSMPTQLTLLPPRAVPMPLKGYLACALTGLDGIDRQLIAHLSDTVTMICQEHGIDLYEPRKKTDPVHHADVPDSEVYLIDRQKVASSDLLVFLTHFPSTGAGEELQIAYESLVPMLLITHEETRVSRMVTGIPAFQVEINYTDPEDLRQTLHNVLFEIRPVLEERKLAFADYDVNIVGERIRLLREDLALTREDVANATASLGGRGLITVEMLRSLEESTDRIANPTLLQLRVLAAILKTTVAELVEPDLGERVVAALRQWMGNQMDDGIVAARWGSTAHDRDRVLRKFLRRVIDALDHD